MAESKITAEEHIQRSRLKKNSAVFGGIIVIGLIVILLLGYRSWKAGWEKMVRLDCLSNLRQISVRCREYAMTNDGHFPTTWSELNLVGEDANWAKPLRCPTTGHDTGDWPQVDFWSDYRLLPGRTTNDPNNTILAIEPLSNHKAAGANILFVDGSTQWWSQSRLLTNADEKSPNHSMK